MKVNSGTIIGLIMGLIFLSILLSVATTTIPTASQAYHTLATSMAGNTTLYGSDASAFASDSIGYLGWFWVIGPFVLVLTLVLSLFRGRR